MIIAYVDPGKHASGVAWFQYRRLIACEYRDASRPLEEYEHLVDPHVADRVDRAVGEIPQVYSDESNARQGRRVRTKDLVELAYALGRMTSALPTTIVTPAAWKGTRKKHVMHDRMLGRGDFAGRSPMLSPDEISLVEALTCPPGKVHNVLDAIAMGLIAEGRWK